MSEEATRANGLGPDAAKAEAVRGALIPWFEENGRDLPWRRTRDPWRVLVSEVMLQQIQVKRAIPFYGRFLERFPTVETLAEAPLSDAIRAWGDLGRYRRVVSLHRTASLIVEEHGGEVPSDPEALLRLPGVGPYTAGAVACFAFERDAAFFDTNMHRVLHRVFFGPDVPKAAAKPKAVMELAGQMVPRGGGWAWNQAVMEFGALRCTARKPGCQGCPLAEYCRSEPEILDLLSSIPRGVARGTDGSYEDSNRYLRGRVLARLRESRDGMMMPGLAHGLRGDGASVGLPRLREVVESLERDGLARTTGEPIHEEPAGAVAERRAPYAAGPDDLSRLRVALP